MSNLQAEAVLIETLWNVKEHPEPESMQQLMY